MVTFTVSGSKANIMDACWEKYNLSYNRRWTPNKKAPALEKGDLIHVFFKYYYTEKMKGRWRLDQSQHGIVLDEATNVARIAASKMQLPVSESDEKIKIARQNLLFHMNDGMTVYAVEKEFTVPIYENPDYIVDPKNPGLLILFDGIVDIVGELPNQPLFVMDHKSESRKSTPFKLSHQFQGSAFAFDVETVIVNKVGFQESLPEKERFRRIYLEYHNTPLLEEWRIDVIKLCLEAIERHKREAMGKPDWPRDRTSCDKYSGCIFQEVCAAIPMVRPVKLQTWFHIEEPRPKFGKDPQEYEEEIEA